MQLKIESSSTLSSSQSFQPNTQTMLLPYTDKLLMNYYSKVT